MGLRTRGVGERDQLGRRSFSADLASEGVDAVLADVGPRAPSAGGATPSTPAILAELLGQSMAGAGPRDRARTLAVLSQLGPAALPALPLALVSLDQEERTQESALEAIAAMGPQARSVALPRVLEILVEASDPGVIAAAARTLRALAPSSAEAAGPLCRTILKIGVELDSTGWWALGECAEVLTSLCPESAEGAAVLEESLRRVTSSGSTVSSRADGLECARALLQGLASFGAHARRSAPLLEQLALDPELGKNAQAALATIVSDEARPNARAAFVYEAPRLPVDAPAAPDGLTLREIEQAEERPEPPSARGISVRKKSVAYAQQVLSGPGQKKSAGLTAEPLSDEVRDEIQAAVRDGFVRVGVTQDASAGEMLVALSALLDQLPRPGGEAEATEEIAFELGAVWGQALVQAANWTWVSLTWADGATPSVISPDRSYVCVPMRLLADALDRGRASAAIELFRSIQRGTLPRVRTGSLTVVG